MVEVIASCCWLGPIFILICVIFHPGDMGAGAHSVNLISSVLETMSALKSALATIHEDQVASRAQQVVSMGALSDGIFALKRVLDARLEECDMSQATQARHGGIFQFEYLTDELPPMVDAADYRVADLERILQEQRSVVGFLKSSELECRQKAIDPFFKQVARVLGCEIINSDSASSRLIVRVGNMEFSGNTDILIGPVDALPLLPIEVKPMTGKHGLKGVQFTKESFSHKTQIALQCAAFQAQCSNSRTQFSCLLTNLCSLYVVQIKSYDAVTISTRIFKVVQDGNHFVRAILRAADDNRSLTKDQKQDVAGPWTCETTTVFDCDRQDPGVSGIPQVPQGSGLLDEGYVAEQGGGDNLSMKAAQMHSNFESLLPTQQQQKSDIRHIYTRLWLRNCAPDCGQLYDISSISNVESVSCSWE